MEGERRIGRYTIRREIGRGGMGTVYLAHDPNFDRDVALKVLPPEFMHDREFRTRFEREARAAALEHPGIVRVYDVGEENGQPYIVMQFMPGGTLHERLEQVGSVPLAAALPWIEAIAEALDYAHSRGIIHRDLKPVNILFDMHDRAYVTDFGIAKLLSTTTAITRSIVGTPAYMSPEQFDAPDTVAAASDQYALAVITYELLSGVRPFESDTPVGFMKKHVLDPVPDLSDRVPGISPALSNVLKRALSKMPPDRFSSCSAFAAALRREADLDDLRTPVHVGGVTRAFESTDGRQSAPGARPSPSRRVPALMWVAGGAALLALVAVVLGAVAWPQIASLANPPVAAEATATATATDVPTALPPSPTVAPPSATATPTTSPTPGYQDLLALGYGFEGSNTDWSPINWIFDDDPVGGELVLVPPGCFTMGTTEDEVAAFVAAGADLAWFDNEQPATEFCFSAPFWLERTEVSQADYNACVAGGACSAQRDTGYSLRDRQPVVGVTWFQARDYCAWRNMRLPSEAEFEYAASGPADWPYTWGTEQDDRRIVFGENARDTVDVNSYPESASWVGAVHLLGNAWEWTTTLYDLDAYPYPYTPLDGRESPSDETTDRTIRGGSFTSLVSILTGSRYYWAPEKDGPNIGIRCVRTP